MVSLVQNCVRLAALAALACLGAGTAQAELFNATPTRTVGPFTAGQGNPQPGGGWTAADDRTLGASLHGQGGWSINCGAANYDQEITPALAHTGRQSWRVSNWFHEGCVNTVLSPAFASVQEGTGPSSQVQAEFWFRVPAGNDGLVVSSSLSDAPGARLSYAAIRDSGGVLAVQVVGIRQGSGWTNTDPPPFDDAGVRYDIRQSGALAHDTWYRLQVSAQLVPGARNDLISYSVFDGAGATVWTSGAMDSWEDAYLAGPFAAPGTKVTLTRLGLRLVENPDHLNDRNPGSTFALNRPAGVFIDDLSVTPGSGSAIGAGFEGERFVANGGSDSGDCSNPAAPCATINYAVAQATPWNTIRIADGTYNENVVVAKRGLRLLGEGVNRPVLTRLGGGTNQALLYVNDVRDVSVENLHFAADKTYVAEGVIAAGDIEGLLVRGNRFVSSQSGAAASTFRYTNAISINHVNNTVGATIRDGRSVRIEDNLVEASGSVAFRAGIQMDRGLGVLRGNTIVSGTQDLIVRFPTVVPGVSTATSVTIADNHLRGRGAQISSPNAGVSAILFDNNEVRAVPNADAYAAAAPSPDPADFSLLRLVHNDSGVPLTVSNNQFLDHAGGYRGVLIQNWPGVQLRDNVFMPLATAADFVSLVLSNKEITTDAPPSPPQPFALTAQGNDFYAANAANAGRAVEFINDNDASGAAVYASLIFGGNTPGEENTFDGKHQRYFRLDDHTCDNAGSTSCGLLNYPGVGAIPDTRVRPFAGNVSAAGNLYDGAFPAGMSAAQRLALQAHTYDDAANAALGLVDYGFSGSQTQTFVDDAFTGQSHGAALSFSHGAVTPGTVYFGINAFATINDAVAHTAAGGTVYIAKGSYGASLVDREVSLVGDGNGVADTVIGATLTIAASGSSASQRLLVRDLRVSNPAGDGIVLTGSQSYLTLERVSASDNARTGMIAYAAPGSTLTRDLRILDSHFDGNGNTPPVNTPGGYVQAGLLFAENASLDGLAVSGSSFDGNSGAGFSVNHIGAPASNSAIRNVLIETSSFSGNAPIGAAPSGDEINYTGGGGIWLKTSAAGSLIDNVEIRQSVFADNGSGRVNPAPVNRRINANGITLRARAGTTLSNVRICDNTFSETPAAGVQEYGIYAFDQTGGWAVDAVELCGTNTFNGLLEGISGFEQFAGTGTQPVIEVSGTLVANGGVARAFVNDAIRRYADASESGTPALHSSIAAAIAAAAPGNAIVLGQGRFRESVVIPATLPGLVLRGSLQGGAIVSEINGADVNGVQLAGNGISVVGAQDVTIKQLRVTRFDSSCIFATPGPGGEPDGLRIGDASLADVDPEAPFQAANYTTELSWCGTAGGIGGGVLLDVGSLLDDVRISHVSTHDNQRRGIAVWDARKTNFVLDNNHVANNSLAGMELLDGAASGVVMRNNLVINNGDAGMGVLGAEGPGVTHIHHNRVQDNGRFGITLNNPSGSGLATPAVAGSGSIVVEDNHVLRTVAPADGRDLSGIAVIRRARDAALNVDVPQGVVVRNNTVSGISQPAADFDGYGIVIEGLQSRVEGNTVSASDIAIQRQAGNTPLPPADGDQAAANAYFGRGNSQFTCAFIGSNTVDGNSVSGSNGSSVRDVDLRPSPAPMSVVVTNADTGRTFCSLQAAIDDATTLNGHVLRVSDGVVVAAQTDVTKRVRITRSGAAGAPDAPVLMAPASVSGVPAVLRVLARDVTVDNLEFRIDLDKLGTAIAALPGGETPSGLVIEGNTIRAIDSNLADPAQAPFAQRHAISLNGRGYAQGSAALSGLLVRNNTIEGSGSGASLRLFGSGVEFDDAPGTPPVLGPPSLATDGITPVLWLDNNRITAGSQDANLRYNNGRVLVSGNTFSGAGLEAGEAQGLFEVDDNEFTPAIPALRSLGIKSVQHSNAYVQVGNNHFAGHAIGVAVQNSQSWHLQDNQFDAPATGDFVHLWINTKVFGGLPLAFARIEADVRGNEFNGAAGPAARGVAVYFADHDYRASRPAPGVVRLGSATAGSADANRFAGAFAHYLYLDPSDCPSSTSSAGCSSGAAPAVFAGYASSVLKPFPADVIALDNGFVATTAGSPVLPRDMSAAQIADLQARTYHDDPLAPEAPPGAPAALGRVEFGFAAASVALSVTPQPGNDGRTYSLQGYAVRVQNSGGAVPEPVKLRYAISRATSSLPSANQPMGADVLQDEAAADSVRNEFADPGCLAANGHVQDGWCLSRLNPAGGGIVLSGEFPQINNGFPVDAGADFSGASRSLFRLPGTYATTLQAVGQYSGTVYASTNFSAVLKQPLAVSYAGPSAVYADGASLPLAFSTAPANDLTGLALVSKVDLSYSAGTGPNDGSSFTGGATAPSLAGGYAVSAAVNDSDYVIASGASASYSVERKPIALAVSGALSVVYSGQPQGLSVTPSQALSGAPQPGSIAIDYSPAPNPPVNAGSYGWSANLTDPNLSATLTSSTAGQWQITRAAPTIVFANLNQIYNGTPRPAAVGSSCTSAISATAPACDDSPAVALHYGAAGGSGDACSGSTTAPVNAGDYEVCGTLDAPNYYAQATARLRITGATLVTDLDGPTTGVEVGRAAHYVARLDNTAAQALTGNVRFLLEITRSGGAISAADLFAVQADEGSGGSFVAAENFGTGPNGGLLFKLDGPLPDDGYALAGNSALLRNLRLHFATADSYTLRLRAESNFGAELYGSDSVVTSVAAVVPGTDTQLSLNGPSSGIEVGVDTAYTARLHNQGTALGENVSVEYCVTRNGLPATAADLSLGYAAASSGPFAPLSLDGNGCATFGPGGGFALPAGYDVTTYFTANFSAAGSYALTAEVKGSTSALLYAAANLLSQVAPGTAGRSVDLAAAGSGLRVGEAAVFFASLHNNAGAIAGMEQQRLCVSTGPAQPATAADLSIEYNFDGSSTYPYALSLDAAGCDLVDGDNGGDAGFDFSPGYAGEVSFRVVFHKAATYTATLGVRGAAAPNTLYASDTLTRVVGRGQAQVSLGNLQQPYTGLHIDASVSTVPALPYSLDYTPANTGPTAAGSYGVTATVDTPDWQGSASGTLVVSDASGLSLGLSGPARTGFGDYVTGFAASLANSGQPTAQPVHTRFTIVRIDDGNADPISAADVDACVQFGDGNAADCPSGYFSLAFAKTTGTAGGRAAVFLRYPNLPANDQPAPNLATPLNVPLALRLEPGEYRIQAEVRGSVDDHLFASSELVTTVPALSIGHAGPDVAAAETPLFGAVVLGNSGGRLPTPAKVRLRLHDNGGATLAPADVDFARQDGGGYVPLVWSQSGSDLVASYVPANGGQIVDGYAATMADRSVYHRLGQYTLSSELVDAATEATLFSLGSQIIEISARGVAITLSDLTQTYNGSPRVAAVNSDPPGVAVMLSYSGIAPTVYGPSATPPAAAGSYSVSAQASSALYSGSASGTLVVNPANATLSLGSLSQTYDGTPRCASVVTNPVGLATTLSYDGVAGCPSAAGSYVVVASISDPNYQGSGSGVLTIAPASGTAIALTDDDGTVDGSIHRSYSGASVNAVSATTTPAGLSYAVTYEGVAPTVYAQSTTPPTAVGNYLVRAATTSADHVVAQTTANLVVDAAATATISIDGAVGGVVTRGYNTAPQAVTATTASPAGLSYTVSYAGIAPTVYPASATPPANVGEYSVTATISDPNHAASAPATATLRITRAPSGVTFGALDFVYDGSAHGSSASLVMDAAAVCSIDYNGAAAGNGTPPVDAGQYLLSTSCEGDNFAGFSSATLRIAPKPVSLGLSLPPVAPYDGLDRTGTASVSGDVAADPASLVVLYDGAATPLPRNAGSYLVQVSLAPAEGNYTAQPVSATLVITKASTVVTLGNLSQTFGAVTAVTASSSATLSGSIAVSYDGSATLPQAVGSYAVAATVNDPNYTGSASATLVIAPATANSIAANGSIAASAVAGAALTGTQPSVRITDGTNPVAGVAVSFSLLSGGGSLSGASVNTDANGVATLGGWTLGANPGTQSVRASAAGVSGTVDFSVNATAEVGLSLSISDGRSHAASGQVLNYLIVAGNAGPSNATAASLGSSLPPQFVGASVTWLCAASSGSSCGAASSGSGNLPASINIAAGGSVSFLLSATLQRTADEAVIYAVNLAPPAGAAGSPASASDQTDMVLFRDGFEVGGDGVNAAGPGQPLHSRDGQHVAGLRVSAVRGLRPQLWLSGLAEQGCRFAIEFARAGDALYVRQRVAERDGYDIAGAWASWPQDSDVLALTTSGGRLQLSGDAAAAVSADWSCAAGGLLLWAGDLLE